MKKNKFISVLFGALAVFFVGLLLGSCSQNEPTLNAPIPSGSFTYNLLTPTSFANPYNLELIASYQNGMQAYWTIPGIGGYMGDTVKVTIPFAGNYVIKYNVGGPGGLSDTISQNITIAEDNPYGIDPNGLLGVLTGAGLGLNQRTWIPPRIVNSVIVWDNYDDCLGQIDGGGGAWWAFGNAEITPGTGRDGYLDDQYTFTFGNSTGPFVYNDNNTIYLDNGGSGWTGALPAPWNKYQGTYATTTPATITSSQDDYTSGSAVHTPVTTAIFVSIAPALKNWASGTFTYSIAPAPAGAKQLGTLTVNGNGAHIGLPDKTNSGDMTTAITVSSITYDVLRISTGLTDANTGATYDLIILGVNESGTVWTFMLRSDQP